ARSCLRRPLAAVPTRRSSDLVAGLRQRLLQRQRTVSAFEPAGQPVTLMLAVTMEQLARCSQPRIQRRCFRHELEDGARSNGPQGGRKSTRLNSSHVKISYAVF